MYMYIFVRVRVMFTVVVCQFVGGMSEYMYTCVCVLFVHGQLDVESTVLVFFIIYFFVTCNCCCCLHFMIYFLSVDCFVVTGGKKRLVTAKSTLPKKINELEIICKVKEIEEERDGEECVRERGRIR